MAGGEPNQQADDSIRLTVPADAAYGRVARTAAAGLALRMGFAYPAIEDLSLAVDELLVLLLHPGGEGGDDDGTVTLVFQPDAEGLTIEASAAASGDRTRFGVEARERFEQLVASTVDSWEVDEGSRTVQLVKLRR